MDVDTIDPDTDFVEVLNTAVSECDVLLAVIGLRWQGDRDASGRRRLANPGDFVRLEIEAALKGNVRVIPLLVEGRLHLIRRRCLQASSGYPESKHWR
jgi:hypothetical protein